MKKANSNNGGHSRPVSSWCNPFTGPPLKSLLMNFNWWLIKTFTLPKYYIRLFRKKKKKNETVIKSYRSFRITNGNTL